MTCGLQEGSCFPEMLGDTWSGRTDTKQGQRVLHSIHLSVPICIPQIDGLRRRRCLGAPEYEYQRLLRCSSVYFFFISNQSFPLLPKRAALLLLLPINRMICIYPPGGSAARSGGPRAIQSIGGKLEQGWKRSSSEIPPREKCKTLERGNNYCN